MEKQQIFLKWLPGKIFVKPPLPVLIANSVSRHVSLLAVARVCPLEADGDAGLAAGGAGE